MILIALGANQPSIAGPPSATLRAALAALAEEGVKVTAVSRFYSSPAWPDPADPPYVNAVVQAETNLTQRQLMDLLHRIEARFGRERRAVNAPRTLDLDIVDYRGRVESPAQGPVLPHPRAHQRVFVLAPLLDVAPDWVHPALGIPGPALLKAAKTAGGAAEPLD
ncbi:2-amino-4-hydroxy-6-hydroxymethyldihydropteridine pyrophosphokinase [Alphaproteobacteria bacterium SO-S41]|nr:2-amino-4-hydroxy-6-hydroxymethyldihydropteridine pyrophosphokinase [Alphaproteobacteria bacterium SO-S41]